MIKVNTVLILGAGASYDFGYPLGEELKNKVINILSDADFQEALKNDYGMRPTIKRLINFFIDDLKKDKVSTIDRFLAKSEDEYKRLGKVAIVQAILSCEHNDRIFQDGNSWYKELYNLINEYPELEEFSQNKISIITFNYDRSLEHYFYERLLGDYGNQRQDAIISELKKIPLIHLHGRVNMLPWESANKSCSYGYSEFAPYVFDVANEMRLPDDENTVYSEAQKLISKAEVIYFLGFGYDQTNLTKLNINLIEKCNRVFGTCHNVTVARQESVNSIFGKKTIEFHSTKVYDFMMNKFNPNIDGGKETITGLRI